MDDLFGEFQENKGSFNKVTLNSHTWRTPPRSKFTKSYWGALNKRCQALDGKLSTQLFERPNLKPTQKHEKEFKDLDAEVYVLERSWKQIIEQEGLKERLAIE